ncbi:hypothetical protein A2V68_00600 [candidate division Kazan bacterium RBG_13_50_9]|uniref:Restriction endonuclease n=1 Tax=candidate division Kazan bacterium RBG_13_50_9 TaxID=1798535 RepID=A0A1F4NTP4_UNCK3|nr:MAG: hypothetical protein A2V68_00600 [candidate division Kazan bacterium RBG_13_50_9]
MTLSPPNQYINKPGGKKEAKLSESDTDRHRYEEEELGPPLDDGLELGEDYPKDDEGQFYREPAPWLRRRSPELLDSTLQFRRRRRTSLVLAKKYGEIILAPATKYKEYQRLVAEVSAPDCLFRAAADEIIGKLTDEILIIDDRDTHRLAPLIEGSRIQWEESIHGQPSELGFMVERLPSEQRQLLEEALEAGEEIEISVLWGPKWKISRFDNGQVHQFNYPQIESSAEQLQAQAERKFLGSNYALFTKVSLARDTHQQLRLEEILVAEANIGTKGGGRPSIAADLGHGRELVQVDRTLPGLIRRHNEGDPLLTEEEYLYNQFPDLVDKVETRDKRWVREHFLRWVTDHVSSEHRVRKIKRFQFRFNTQGEVVTDDESFERRPEYFQPIRINVREDGYLCNVLEHIVERSHMLRRLDKYRNFADNYPVFREVLMRDREEGVARTIFRTEAMVKRLLRRSQGKTLRNLAYLLYFFAADKEFAQGPFPSGVELVRSIVEALKAENQRLYEKRSTRAQAITEEDWGGVVEKVREMLHPRYFALAQQARWVEKLSVHGPRRLYSPRINHQPQYVGAQFKRLIKRPDPVAGRRPKRIFGFDIYPPEKTLKEHQVELANIFIDYVDQLGQENQMPNAYALHRDRKPRLIEGQMVDGNYIYNRARVLWRDPETQTERSSLHAIRSLFALAKRLLPEHARDPQKMAELEKLLDYEAVSQTAWESRHTTGRMGEIFVGLALKTNVAALLGIEELPAEVSCQILFANMDRHLGNHSDLPELNLGLPQKKMMIPDFILQLRDAASGEMVKMLLESKTYLKPITSTTAESIIKQYTRALEAGWGLLVVSNSPWEAVRQEAIDLFRQRNIILLCAEDVARALDTADPQKYRVPPHAQGRTLGEYYLKFSQHPGAFAAREIDGELVNQQYAKIYRRILRDEAKPTLFTEDSYLYYQLGLP